VHDHLGGVGAWDEVRGPDEIEEVLACDPLAPFDELVVHHGDMRSGAAESDEPEAKEETGDLQQTQGANILVPK
jgi:hypothetical protein